jgi:hypothetical protein
MIKQWITVVVVACTTQLFSAPNDSIVSDKTAVPRKVLIVKGDSYLENAVTKILLDSLGRKNITVETARIKKWSNENSASYTAIIVFSAIKVSKQSDPLTRKYMSTKSNDPTSNVMVCTVYGEKWDNTSEKVDAVSAATKTLKPPFIASNIFSFIADNYLK